MGEKALSDYLEFERRRYHEKLRAGLTKDELMAEAYRIIDDPTSTDAEVMAATAFALNPENGRKP